jgi:hypothetical protein
LILFIAYEVYEKPGKGCALIMPWALQVQDLGSHMFVVCWGLIAMAGAPPDGTAPIKVGRTAYSSGRGGGVLQEKHGAFCIPFFPAMMRI